ncbi:glycosyltransferase [Aquimarina sp. D1M17]|uniref:glycosyltransferase n=1 Tax=Aquimarina acroporae TaxID=2937283 RepID=UPI0020BE2788|nr:glycosyltransferase [Aquimarina acroporae]MCK8523321.1 glycosyltransferase [Aquimarina acroporae]
MKKIKVLHISETFAAGVYTYIKDINQFFKNIDDVESYVIYSGNRKDTDREKFKTDFPESSTLIEVSMTREISPVQDFKSTIALFKQIRKIKPDVIHLHSSKAGVIGRIASKAYPKAKVYYTPNGYSFLREDVSNFKKSLFRTIEKWINLIFGGVTVACGDTEFDYAQKIGKALLVRNGVEINSVYKFKEHNSNKNESQFVVGTMGRLSPQKNPGLFNDIALKMPGVKFIWIGDGELSNLITASNIEVTGWMPREKALETVNQFDVYIQTSLWEGLPFTIIEAMILEKPIIANNVIGNKDAVKDKYNGFLCNTLEEFVNSIETLQKDENLLKEMETNSNKRAKELFDRDKNFLELAEIYRS